MAEAYPRFMPENDRWTIRQKSRKFNKTKCFTLPGMGIDYTTRLDLILSKQGWDFLYTDNLKVANP